MKFNLIGLAAAFSVMTLSAIAPAQSQDYNDGLKEELNQDVNQMYPKRTKGSSSVDSVEVQTVKVKQVQPASQGPSATQGAQALPVQAQTTVGAPQNGMQPIYILQQPAAAPAAQAQPVTTIESTPVKESRGEQLRKQREEVEHQTENKLMERLEDDRLMSEKDRSERIFNPLNGAAPAASPAPAPVVAPGAQAAPLADVAPVAVIAPAQQQNDEKFAATAPVNAVAVTDDNAIVRAKTDDHFGENDEDRTKFVLGAAGGIASYPSTGNVNGDYAAGISGEMLFPGRLGLEVQALFSQYDVSVPTGFYYLPMLETLNQTNITTGLNYHILDGRISPVVGVLAGYTRRNYSSRNNSSYGYGYGYGYGNNYNNAIPGSNAFDGGFKLGVDVNATKKFTVGVAFNYMMNISYRTDNPYQYYGTPLQPIESLSYYFATLNLKLAL